MPATDPGVDQVAAPRSESCVGGAYRGAVIAFATLHGKHWHVAPAFADILDARVIAADSVDTDQFGTFTGDIARSLAPVEAARAKARLGMQALGLPYGLASEASYGPLPGLGLPGHEEILLFLDDTRGLEVIQGNRTLSHPGPGRRARNYGEIEPALAAWGFPGQAVTARPALGGAPRDIVKGISDPRQLGSAIRAAAERSEDGHALIEPDLRAHHNPTRQTVLTHLGQSLARRLDTACPACASPGYGQTATVPGLPCAACHTPTDLAQADTYTCPVCPCQHTRARAVTTAEPRWCPDCNP
ncbi:MAG: DUF6671 family protein [Jatrophihabitantaceae bacterium]